MSEANSEQAGRVIVLMYIVLVLLLSAATIALYVSTKGPESLPPRIVRFVLTVALCAWLYSGSKVAKWIFVVLSGLGGVLVLPVVFSGVLSGNVVAVAYGGVMSLVYLSFALILIFSPHVNAFFDRQRHDGTGPEPRL